MLHLNIQGLKDRSAWEAAGIALPRYDVEAMKARTLQRPSWVHFGAGNIFSGDPVFNAERSLCFDF